MNAKYAPECTMNGMCYKDWDAFRNEPDKVCYIPEAGFADDADECGLVSSDSEYCWTGKQIIEWCGGNEDLAEYVFGEIDWQSPSTFLDELLMHEPGVIETYGK